VLYEGIHCRLAIEQPAAGVIVLRLNGWDVGEFGDAPMKEIGRLFEASRPTQLYIDARQVKGATIDVSNDWAVWLASQRSAFSHISMLTGGPFVQLTAKFVRRFAGLDDTMRIYTEAAAFDRALGEAIAAASAPGVPPQAIPAASGR
jgi:hypothetical protein